MKKYVNYLIGLVLFSFLARVFIFETGGGTFVKSVKSAFSPIIHAYLVAFQDPDMAFLLFLCICGACFFCLYWIYFLKYIPLRKKLVRSFERVEAVREALHAGEIDPIRALKELEEESFLRTAILKFQKGMFSKNDLPHVNLLETSGFPLKIIASLPGYFVGFGLIFTFLGLVAALFFAAQGMGSGDYAVAKSSLAQLLHAASFKFTTSVAGIASSLAISILYKYLLHDLHLRIDLLKNTGEEIFFSVSQSSPSLGRSPSSFAA